MRSSLLWNREKAKRVSFTLNSSPEMEEIRDCLFRLWNQDSFFSIPPSGYLVDSSDPNMLWLLAG